MSGGIATKFFLADDIRLESSGKQTLVGLFADDTIVLLAKSGEAPSEKANAIIRFSFMLTFFGLSKGARKTTVEIHRPSGTRISNRSGDLVLETKADGATTNLVISVPAFPVAEVGTYKIVANLAGEVFEFFFRVQRKLMAGDKEVTSRPTATKRTKKIS